jgi:hypothetical protein
MRIYETRIVYALLNKEHFVKINYNISDAMNV